MRQAGDLDVVGFVTILLQAGGVGRHKRKALHLAQETDIAIGRVDGEADAAKGARMPAAIGIKRPHLQTLLRQHVEVDIGDRRLVRHRKPFGLGQSITVLEDRGLAVPGKVGGGFASAGGGIQIGGEAAGGLRPAQQTAGFRLADGDVAGRQIGQDRGAGDGGFTAGRVRHPDVLADFGVDNQALDVGRFPQQVGAERDGAALDGDAAAIGAVAADEVPGFVELPVVRQVDLWHHAQKLAAMDCQGAVVKRAHVTDRRADQQQRHQVCRTGDDGIDRGFYCIEHGLLLQQVGDRVAGNSQFREHRDGDRLTVAIPRHCQDGLRVADRIGQRGACGAGGDTGEAVAVQRSEAHGGLGLSPGNMAWVRGLRHRGR